MGIVSGGGEDNTGEKGVKGPGVAPKGWGKEGIGFRSEQGWLTHANRQEAEPFDRLLDKGVDDP